jgi:hypothetical protein
LCQRISSAIIKSIEKCARRKCIHSSGSRLPEGDARALPHLAYQKHELLVIIKQRECEDD